MSNIQQFNLNDAIRARVREALFGAIPQEVMDEYIQREMDAFFVTKKDYNREIPSEFRNLVWASIRETVSPLIAEWLKEKAKDYLDEHGDEKFRREMADAVVTAQNRFIEESLRYLSASIPMEVERKLREMQNQGRL